MRRFNQWGQAMGNALKIHATASRLQRSTGPLLLFFSYYNTKRQALFRISTSSHHWKQSQSIVQVSTSLLLLSTSNMYTIFAAKSMSWEERSWGNLPTNLIYCHQGFNNEKQHSNYWVSPRTVDVICHERKPWKNDSVKQERKGVSN